MMLSPFEMTPPPDFSRTAANAAPRSAIQHATLKPCGRTQRPRISAVTAPR